MRVLDRGLERARAAMSAESLGSLVLTDQLDVSSKNEAGWRSAGASMARSRMVEIDAPTPHACTGFFCRVGRADLER